MEIRAVLTGFNYCGSQPVVYSLCVEAQGVDFFPNLRGAAALED